MASGLSPKPEITVDKLVGCINPNSCIHLRWETSVLRISLSESEGLFTFLLSKFYRLHGLYKCQDIMLVVMWMFSRYFAVFELKLRFSVSLDVNWSQAISTQLYTFSRSVFTCMPSSAWFYTFLISVFMCGFRQTKQRRFNSFNCLMSV